MGLVAGGSVDIESGSEQTTWSLPMPSGVAEGDLLVVTLTTGSGDSTLSSGPAGVTTHEGLYGGLYSSFSGAIYTYTVPASPPANLEWTFGAAERGSLAWMHFDDVAAAGVIGFEINDEGYVDEFAVPSITTTEPDCLLVGGFMQGSGSSTGTPPSGWVTRVDAPERNGYLATNSLVQAIPGASGDVTFESSSGATGRAWQMAIALTAAAAPTPGVTYSIIGAPQPDGFTVNAKVTNAVSARLVVASEPTLTNDLAYSSSDTPDSDGFVSLTISGLPSRVRDYYGLELTDSGAGTTVTTLLGSPRRIQLTTTTYTVAFGSCWDNGKAGSPSFDMILDRDPHLFFHLGDWSYDDSESTSQASHRADMEAQLSASPSLKELVANVPTVYVKSDHDGDANEQGPGQWTAPNRAATLQMFPYNARPDANGLYHAFTVGRVRFIFIDTRYLGDNSTTRLGATQKAWLKDEMERSEPLKVLVQDSTWITNEPAGVPGEEDDWATYSAERTELGNHWTTNGVGTLVTMHGDQHALAADDGSNNPWGGFPSFCAAPFSNQASLKTLSEDDWSHDFFPSSSIGAPVEQYGLVTFTDAGGAIDAAFRGYDSSDTERISLTVGAGAPNAHYAGTDIPVAAYVGNQLAVAAYVGSTLVWETPVPQYEDMVIPASVDTLTSPEDRWVKPAVHLSWFDGDDWRAVLPLDGGTDADHIAATLNPGGTITEGPTIDTRLSTRPAVVVDDSGAWSVLTAHASASRLNRYSSEDIHTLQDVSVPLPRGVDNDAAPTVLHRSGNGHLWAANVQTGGDITITKSTDGSSWSTPVVAASFPSSATGVVVLESSGSDVILFATANDGAGLLAQRIPDTATDLTSINWITESLASLPAGVTSDDHASSTVLDDGRVVVVGKTTNDNTSALLFYLMVRETNGTWATVEVLVSPDTSVGYTRPSITVKDDKVHLYYGKFQPPYGLYVITADVSDLQTWSAQEVVAEDANNYSGSAILPEKRFIDAARAVGVNTYPVLAPRTLDSDISLFWR